MIGYGSFVPRKRAHVHLYGPVQRTDAFTTMRALCGRVKGTWKVANAWAPLYHDYETPQAAASQRQPSCPKCKPYAVA